MMRGRDRPTAIVAGVCLLGMAVAGPAAASVVRVAEGSACPSPEQVVTELRRLLRDDTGVSVGSGEGTQVDVTDLGDRVRVFTRGAERTLPDTARRCDERARSVAVFAALVLEPPGAADSSPPPAAPPPIAPPPSRPVTSTPPLPLSAPPAIAIPIPPAPLVLELEAAAVFDVAPSGGSDTAGGGGALRINALRDRLGLTAGLGAQWQGSVAVGPGRAQLVRVPLDLGLRGVLRRGRLEADASLGLVLALLDAQGQGFPVNHGGDGLDVGVRAAVGVRAWVSERLALVARLHASYSPSPPVLHVDPSVAAVSAPAVWIGLDLGVATRIR